MTVATILRLGVPDVLIPHHQTRAGWLGARARGGSTAETRRICLELGRLAPRDTL
jgi:hypothetical protein